MKNKSIYQKVLESFGEDALIQINLEEMGELLQALCKYKRKFNSATEEEKAKLIDNIQEEIADVLFSTEQLAYVFGQEQVQKVKDYKMKRALKRVELGDLNYKDKP